MFIKFFIFRCNKRLLNSFGNFAFRYKQTFLGGIFHQQLTVTGIKTRGDRRFVFGQLVIIRQLFRYLPETGEQNNQPDNCKKEKCTDKRR